MKRLSELNEGETATVSRLEGPVRFRQRLLEMGFIRGVDIYVEKYAPLNDPIEVIIKDYHVSLRVEEAEKIIVR